MPCPAKDPELPALDVDLQNIQTCQLSDHVKGVQRTDLNLNITA